MTTATVPIRRYPTRLHVRCGKCQHQGFVTVFLDKPPKLRCTVCGSRAATIVTRIKRSDGRSGAARQAGARRCTRACLQLRDSQITK